MWMSHPLGCDIVSRQSIKKKLEGAAQGGLVFPSLEVSEEFLDVALGALGWGQTGD